jgi:shikimate kinase
MSTLASSRELLTVAELVEPRARAQFSSDVARYKTQPKAELTGHVVLVGHRGAGKSRLLKPLAGWMKRPGVDLDEAIARRTGATVRSTFERSPAEFRRLERQAFCAVEDPALIAAGGGFLFHHADLLASHTAVLVPLSLETFRERMRADRARPRLKPELSLDDEIEFIFAEREPVHREARTIPLAQLVAAL